ncbi:vitamin B12 transporter [Bibersteinia trehalosi]|uniref:TonB-dependent receptor plug domain-containing protein n=1 Tax=Bibersteinia trehalosi TaxID=47735 RepID=UPI0010468B88|nr:TonB-dependent receptor [Bibersteinia trehalosi]TCT14734.1 vitamin B12 transporter [Bibersteinia trehalosi]
MKKNLITTTILLSLSGTVFANEQTQQVVLLDEVKVYSAYAAPVNQDKTASSVTVLTEKDFKQRNATYVSDVLKTVPGVAIVASGGRGTLTNMFLRGADANHTAVIIDGVKVNPVNGNGYDFGGLSLSNVERIEVLRGEQSALWGSDAMGGVIYITTKSGLYQDKAFNIDFDFGGGTNKTSDGSVTISGHDNGFYYALHGSSHHTRSISAQSRDTFRYTAVDGTEFTTGGAIEKDKFHSDKASLKVGYDDGHKGVELLASHSTQTAAYDGSIATETNFNDRTRSRETLFRLGGYVGSDHELFKHSAAISHVKTDSDTFEYSYGSVGLSTVDAKKLNANYQLDVNFDREGPVIQAVSLLADYQKTHYDAVSSWATFENKQLSEKSVAAEYRYFHENDHSLSVSGRYTDSSQFDNSFTGRISAGIRLAQNFRLHGSYGKAIQNPATTEFYGWSGSFVGNPNLKPEKSRGGDVGLLIESTNKHHSLDLTYFARNVTDYIGSECLATITSAWGTSCTTYRSINNDGTTKIKGAEIAYNGRFTDSLTGFANYTYTRAKNNLGVELYRRPKHQANAGIHFQVTDKFGTQAGLSYVGKRIDNYPYLTKMPSYTLVNLGADYQLNANLNAYVNLNNVANKKYENILGYGQYGRTVYVGLKGSF